MRPYRYSAPAPIQICSGETWIPLLRPRYRAMAWHSAAVPRLGQRSMSPSWYSLSTRRMVRASTEKGNSVPPPRCSSAETCRGGGSAPGKQSPAR